MPTTSIRFPISYKIGQPNRPIATIEGLGAASEEDFKDFVSCSGLVGKMSSHVWNLRVDLPEGERLRALFDLIEERYGFRPNMERRVVRKEDEGSVYGVKKYRYYSETELDMCEFLYIGHIDKQIAKFASGTEDQIRAEKFVAYMHKKKKNVQSGTLEPFHATAMTGEFKSLLEKEGLKGLRFEPVVNGDDIWKVYGETRMPRSLNPLQDGQGNYVEADEWPSKWSDKYIDDEGYLPPGGGRGGRKGSNI